MKTLKFVAMISLLAVMVAPGNLVSPQAIGIYEPGCLTPACFKF